MEEREAEQQNQYILSSSHLIFWVGISLLPNIWGCWKIKKKKKDGGYEGSLKTLKFNGNGNDFFWGGVILKVIISLPFPHTVHLSRMPFVCLSPEEPGVPGSAPNAPTWLWAGGSPSCILHQAPLGCLLNVPLEKKGIKWGSSLLPRPLPSELPVWVKGPRSPLLPLQSAWWLPGECAPLDIFLDKVMYAPDRGKGCG